VEARTIHGQGPDGPRPGAEAGSLPDGPDGPRVRRGGGVRRWRLDLAPGRDPSGRRGPRTCLGLAGHPRHL
jgi:hypothetical protein